MTSKVVYQGELRSVLTHNKSQQQIITDAPVDNHGKGEAFSPTDLLATSLGACILTVLGIRAEQMGLNISGSSVQLEKLMETNPRRVSGILVELEIMGVKEKGTRALFERLAYACPVAKSLHPDIKQDLRFTFSD